jgi:ankyrin repeat protein
MLLLGRDVDLNVCVKGVLPLQLAVDERIQYTSDLDTPAAKNNLSIIQILAIDADQIHACNEEGFCPFDYAVMAQLMDVCELFISTDADLYRRKNKLNRTPIEVADKEFNILLQENFPMNRSTSPTKQRIGSTTSITSNRSVKKVLF